ncbi:MAG: YihA family ribosome biogenesis GTP-binding protein [Legionellales bacterium RIFCSPHIGHO2_12_FULL_42_9]|nr:MAG: YihA family ribosome biogenesis GTP-binding protein [Legionellales bacterium RIFCSPHIGHO2_12_FULL_42_9]
MVINRYRLATFLKSAALVKQLPPDEGYEIAFAGRSNAGKSTALNTLAIQKRLARTSKTPGRTQLINLFALDESRRLVDLPGYGFADVPIKVKEEWQRTLAHYLEVRTCLCGIVLLMDCRHPLQELDQNLIKQVLAREIPIHILLTKSDKLSRGSAKNCLTKVRNEFKDAADWVSVQTFSSLNKEGIDELITQLDTWFEWDKP